MPTTLSPHALTTLEAVKEELDISIGDSVNDNYLTRLINSASDAIERYCDRHFEKASLIEKVAGQGSQRVLLSRAPILSVTSVILNGSVLASSEYEVEAEAGMLFRASGWPWSAMRRPGIVQDPYPGSETKSIEVTYIGGYVLPKDENLSANPPVARTLPYDLEEACIATVKTWFRAKGADLNRTSRRLMDVGDTWDRRALPEPVREMLAPWRRIA